MRPTVQYAASPTKLKSKSLLAPFGATLAIRSLSVTHPEQPEPALPPLETMPYDRVEKLYRDGYIAYEVWDAYCYKWRNETFRFSTLGARDAARHARLHGLPLPSSDARIEEKEDG